MAGTPRRGTPRQSASVGHSQLKKDVAPSPLRQARPKQKVTTAPRKVSAARQTGQVKPGVSYFVGKLSLPFKKAPQKPMTRAEQRRAQAEANQAHYAAGDVLRKAIIGAIVLLGVVLVGLILYLVLSFTPLFTIDTVVADATEHVSSDSLSKLANIQKGTTLLNLNEAEIAQNIKKNPWVGQVSFSREFPSTLRITITERTASAIVLMGSNSKAWYLSSDSTWIEPAQINPQNNQSYLEAAIAVAESQGLLVISDLPATVSPVAGATATDEALLAVGVYESQLSDSFKSQIVSFSAASTDSIACTLKSGVEVSFGSTSSITNKESIVTALLNQYPNKLTYINVRVPSNPSYRMVSSDTVKAGTGTTVDSTSSTDTTGTSTTNTTTTDSAATDSGTTSDTPVTSDTNTQTTSETSSATDTQG